MRNNRIRKSVLGIVVVLVIVAVVVGGYLLLSGGNGGGSGETITSIDFSATRIRSR